MKVPYENILVYIDGSEASMSALMYAILIAERTKCKLDVIYVINTKALQDLVKNHVFLQSESLSYEKDIEEDASRYLFHAKKMAKTKNVEITTYKEKGSVVTCVQNYIKNNSIDLLVIGSQTSLRARRDEVASETDRLLRSISIASLVVKDNQDIWDEFEKEKE